jgi:predicted acylesterase/phospholipase RssA
MMDKAQQLLFESACRGDIDGIIRALNSGADLHACFGTIAQEPFFANYQNSIYAYVKDPPVYSKVPPLFAAVYYSNKNAVNLLIEKGADINETVEIHYHNISGKYIYFKPSVTALVVAALYNRTEIVTLLLQLGASTKAGTVWNFSHHNVIGCSGWEPVQKANFKERINPEIQKVLEKYDDLEKLKSTKKQQITVTIAEESFKSPPSSLPKLQVPQQQIQTIEPNVEFLASQNGYIEVKASLNGVNGHWHITGLVNGEKKTYFMLLHPSRRRPVDIGAQLSGNFKLEVKMGDKIKIQASANVGDVFEKQVTFSGKFYPSDKKQQIANTTTSTTKSIIERTQKREEPVPTINPPMDTPKTAIEKEERPKLPTSSLPKLQVLQQQTQPIEPNIEFSASQNGYIEVKANLNGVNGHWHITGLINGEKKAYFMLLHPSRRRTIDIGAQLSGNFKLEVKMGDKIKIQASANIGDAFEKQVIYSGKFYPSDKKQQTVNTIIPLKEQVTPKKAIEQKILPYDPEQFLKTTRPQLQLDQLSQIENLIFQGGGVKGIAYLGAIKVLCDENAASHIKLAKIKRVGGASAGAITALLVALNHNYQELQGILTELNMKELLDDFELDGFKIRDQVFKLVSLAKALQKREDLKNEIKNLIAYVIFHFVKNYAEKQAHSWLADKSETAIINKIKEQFLPADKLVLSEGNQDKIDNYLKKLLHEIFLISSEAFNWVDEKCGQYFGKTFHFIRGQAEQTLNNFIYQLFEKYTPINLRDAEKFFLSLVDEEKKPLFKDLTELNETQNALYIIVNRIIWGKPGIFPGEAFKRWLEEKIANKTHKADITFKQLKEQKHYKDLYIVALNLSTGLTTIFSHEHTPDVIVAEAIRASMSIPYFFVPTKVLTSKGDYQEEYHADDKVKPYTPLFTDGGVLDNYPIWLFDHIKYIESGDYKHHLHRHQRNYHTLGLRLVTKDTKALLEFKKVAQPSTTYDDADCWNYSKALFGTMLGAKQDNDHYHSRDKHRTVYIDTQDVSTVDFNLTDDNKKALKKSAEHSAIDYLIRAYRRQEKRRLVATPSQSTTTIGTSPLKMGI